MPIIMNCQLLYVNEARGAKDTLGYSFEESCIKYLEHYILRILESLLGADESCLMEVLHESSYTDMMDSPCSLPSDAEAPLEDQPLPANASPTALSLGYVVDSNPDEDPDEDPEEDPEEDHADYPADGGDGDDEPSDDDDDDDDTDDEDEEPFEDEDDDEEEEHLASADYLLATRPIVDPVPSYGDTRH
ncbi:hypothetical protein Tco_1047421 [Tanacetum coccineum]